MNKPNLQKIITATKTFVSAKSPEILTGIGIAGMITTTVLAVKATPKALMLIDNKKEEIFNELDPSEIPGNNVNHKELKLKPIEVVKVAWKPYIPAALTCAASTACLIGASSVNAKRNAALATAYELSKTALTEYKAKVVETIGEKKEKAIKDSIAKDKVEQNPVSTKEVIITGNGDTLCLDATFNQYFDSDIEKIKKAVNDVNYRMLGEQYISLNEFYDELGIKHIKLGDSLGWNISRDGMLEVDFSSQIADNGKPCIVMQYTVAPQYDYYKL